MRKLYRYYVSSKVLKEGAGSCPIGNIPAGEIEGAVIDQLRTVLRSPELIVRTWRIAYQENPAISEHHIREVLVEFDAIWDELFPAEQARIVQLLVERVSVRLDGIDIQLRAEGLTSLVEDMRSFTSDQENAA